MIKQSGVVGPIVRNPGFKAGATGAIGATSVKHNAVPIYGPVADSILLQRLLTAQKSPAAAQTIIERLALLAQGGSFRFEWNDHLDRTPLSVSGGVKSVSVGYAWPIVELHGGTIIRLEDITSLEPIQGEASVQKADYHDVIVDPLKPQGNQDGWHPPQNLPSQPEPQISPTVSPNSSTPPNIIISGPTPYKPSDNKDYHDQVVDPLNQPEPPAGWHAPQSLPPQPQRPDLTPAPGGPKPSSNEVHTSETTTHGYKP